MNKMKKITGWLLIVVCSAFLLMFAITTVVIVIRGHLLMTNKTIISTVIGFVFVSLIFTMGLMRGIQKVKKDKKKIIAYEGTLNLNLTGQIAYKDYRNVLFELNLKNPFYIIFICIFILILLSIMLGNSDLGNRHSFIIISVFFVVLISPISILLRTKKLYQTNKMFQERMDYTLTNEFIHIKGETVDSTQKWARFYKVKETKRFFLFYQGEGVATFLDKKMFSENELDDFRQFIRSLDLKS